MSGPRDLRQRTDDAFKKLENDRDIWVATASASGSPCLVPLSFAWVDERVLLVTERGHRTARNIAATGVARLALGPTRDVVSLAGEAEILEWSELPDADAAGYTARTGWDPRADDSLVWIVFRPHRIQVWREIDEIPERTIMEGGVWLA